MFMPSDLFEVSSAPSPQHDQVGAVNLDVLGRLPRYPETIPSIDEVNVGKLSIIPYRMFRDGSNNAQLESDDMAF